MVTDPIKNIVTNPAHLWGRGRVCDAVPYINGAFTKPS